VTSQFQILTNFLVQQDAFDYIVHSNHNFEVQINLSQTIYVQSVVTSQFLHFVGFLYAARCYGLYESFWIQFWSPKRPILNHIWSIGCDVTMLEFLQIFLWNTLILTLSTTLNTIFRSKMTYPQPYMVISMWRHNFQIVNDFLVQQDVYDYIDHSEYNFEVHYWFIWMWRNNL
jgi:hypothetical protein